MKQLLRLPLFFVLGLLVFTGASVHGQSTDPFGARATYMNVFDNNNGEQGGYVTGINQYGPADLIVEGDGAVGSTMVFRPNTLEYVRNRYVDATTFFAATVGPTDSNALLEVSVSQFDLPEGYRFEVFVKVLDPSNGWGESAGDHVPIDGTGTFAASLPALDGKTGQNLQVGLQMFGPALDPAIAQDFNVTLQITRREVLLGDVDYVDTTPQQMLRNGDFDGEGLPSDLDFPSSFFWLIFEGTYVTETPDPVSPSGGNVLVIAGQPYAGTWYDGVTNSGASGIEVFDAAGDVFTLTFEAYFPAGYQATTTGIQFSNFASGTQLADIDISDQLGGNLGAWKTYQVRYQATAEELTDLLTGNLRMKIQPDGRTAGDILMDNFILKQQTAEEVGAQLSLGVGGGVQANGSTETLNAPLVTFDTPYAAVLRNSGVADLKVSDYSVTGDFAFSPDVALPTLPFTIAPGASQTISLQVSPGFVPAPLTGGFSVTSNDADDPVYVVNMEANPVAMSDDFSTGTPEALGYQSYSTFSKVDYPYGSAVSGGALNVGFAATPPDVIWEMGLFKQFASPYRNGLAALTSTISAALSQAGSYNSFPSPIGVRLESLSAAGAVTGTLFFGEGIDDGTAGAVPPDNAYYTPDGTINRYGLVVPAASETPTELGPTVLSTSPSDVNFDYGAPAFRLVVAWSDKEMGNFGQGLATISVDSLGLDLQPGAAPAFAVNNGSFESDTPGDLTASAPTGWIQFPQDGVSKAIMADGDPIYNSFLTPPADDDTLSFAAYAGSQAMKVYGQNYYVNDVWQGPSQTGTTYQEFTVGATAGLSVGTAIHATAASYIYSVDPLANTAEFFFGFKYYDAAGLLINQDVAVLNASSPQDQWVTLVANGTVPSNTLTVQVVCEFLQNAATDAGSVYLDQISAGFGVVPATSSLGDETSTLLWSDEFDGDSLKLSNWTYDIGTGPNGDGWGNNEAQVYTDSPENLAVVDGALVITALNADSEWTSARINTKGQREFPSGIIEIVAKLPKDVQGSWPAGWTLGANIDTVGWPTCNEIDILEYRATFDEGATVGQATHTPANSGAGALQVSPRPVVADVGDWNTYAVKWDADGRTTFYVNGVKTGTWNAGITNEQFLLLNLAMGGSYNGGFIAPGLSSVIYQVDSIRVYSTSSVTPPASEYDEWLEANGLDSGTAFGSTDPQTGSSVGVLYSMGNYNPSLLGSGGAESSAAVVTELPNGDLVFIFDLRDDGNLAFKTYYTDDLVVTPQSMITVVELISGAPADFQRTKVTFTPPAPSSSGFVTLEVDLTTD